MFGNKLKGITLTAVTASMLSASVIGSSGIAHAADVKTNAASAILVDGDTGKILFAKKADQVLPPASMSKMMTEYLVNEAIKKGKIQWDQKVTISDYAYKISQNRQLSNVPLRIDYKYTVKELYEAMAIYSANGATIALAELLGDGSEGKFVKVMNKKAKELGIKNAKFVNSSGLNNEDLQGFEETGGKKDENEMTAKGVATLAYRLITDYPEVLDTAKIPVKWFRKGTKDQIKMQNWNWMLPSLVYGYKGMDGLKTGTTNNAGYSFAGTAKRGDTRLLSVIMKTKSYKGRFGETKKLMDYGFTNFTKQTLLPKGYQLKDKKTLSVAKGSETEVGIATKEPVSVLVKKGEKSHYKPVFVMDKKHLDEDGNLKAPLKKGEVVGHIQMKYTGSGEDPGYLEKDGSGKGQTPVVTTEAVDEANWFVLMMRSIGHFFSNAWDSITSTVKGWF
ncbi:serine-type D-Ala-D-Ala carboxypeptidase [Fictibacillus macauensis ZFHKF-1]|uniref:serine-type D-Ala-D-Ala carboxypeptidase n=1 Tax=Fictibacillus macauensis ZFHKF-1 TaxID=1196324 RepID=I8AEN9_9BACL|nr:serine hydrolase [Fictibacillus macauensis]EIT83804.1 serine-type D-Ala-D-Ala carboxypeptidase [Fictibacillus macauensis ZFHKF-1]